MGRWLSLKIITVPEAREMLRYQSLLFYKIKGNCAICGADVLTPDPATNYGSIKRLKKYGFTGDIDPSTWKQYCFKCMRKIGWSWGEKPEPNEDSES